MTDSPIDTMTATTAPPAAAIVEATDVAKRWSPTAGLAPVTFTLRTGDSVVLCGRSGSGKSTVLGLLAGWCEPDSGRLERIGTWADDQHWREWRGTAVVPQLLGLLQELPLRENISLGLRLGGIDRRSLALRTQAVIEALDLAEQADRLPAEVSLGQRQRAAAARAVVSAPTLLLADEPTCHQDAAHATMVLEALRSVALLGGAVLVASHDESIIASAERTISLD